MAACSVTSFCTTAFVSALPRTAANSVLRSSSVMPSPKPILAKASNSFLESSTIFPWSPFAAAS